MQDILQYIVKWSIALCAVFVFYRFVLRPLTFYQWNRHYLVAYSIIALFIPFINLYTYVPEQQLQQNHLVKFIPVINIGQQQTASSTNIDPWFMAGVLMLAGSLFLLARLVVQWISLSRIRRRATRIYHPEAKVFHVDENVIPFSFGDAIYVNTSLHTEQELNGIILHEFVHVRQKHSFDIIWSEILCILNWYNPFAWLIRHAIRQNLEFIADQSVLNNGLDKKTYQYHLLKVIGSSQYSIANNFNFSSLKKRIAMMNRLKSARVHLVKFLFVLPLLAIMLVAFRNSKGNWYQDIVTDTIKKPDPAALAKAKNTMKQGLDLLPLDEFYKKNSSVKEVAWSSDDEIVLYLKNGTREAYDSNSEADMKRLNAAYGGIPAVFPLIPAEKPEPPENPLPPAAPGKPARPLPPPPPAKLPGGAINLQDVDGVVTLTFKDGRKETYNLNKPEERASMEKKYGAILRLTELPAQEIEVAQPPKAGKPAVIEIPASQEKTAVVEVAAPQKTAVAENVIHLKGDVSLSLSDSVSKVIRADEIIVHGGVSPIAGHDKYSPLYYVDGKKAAIQDSKVLTEKFKISHMEIINNPVAAKIQGEVSIAPIINLITVQNAKNVNAYMAKESIKLIEETKVKPAPAKEREY
jgi:hypothetical protein